MADNKQNNDENSDMTLDLPELEDLIGSLGLIGDADRFMQDGAEELFEMDVMDSVFTLIEDYDIMRRMVQVLFLTKQLSWDQLEYALHQARELS